MSQGALRASSAGHVEARSASFWKNNLRDYGLLVSLLLIMGFFEFMTGGVLFRGVNVTNLILQNSYIVIMALGMLLVIVGGNIDLSVGSIVGFVGGGRGDVDGRLSCPWLEIDVKLPWQTGHPDRAGAGRPDRRRAGLFHRLQQDPGLHRDARRAC